MRLISSGSLNRQTRTANTDKANCSTSPRIGRIEFFSTFWSRSYGIVTTPFAPRRVLVTEERSFASTRERGMVHERIQRFFRYSTWLCLGERMPKRSIDTQSLHATPKPHANRFE